MPKVKGSEKTGGRGAGTPNKATGQAREAIAAFVDNNADRLVGWLDKIANEDPEAAFKAFMSVVEYHIPKLARHEEAVDPNANTMNIIIKQYSPLGDVK